MVNIVFISEFIGDKSGAQQSAIDVIVDILANGHKLSIVTTSPLYPLPKEITGQIFDIPRWLQVPNSRKFKSFGGNIFRRIAAFTYHFIVGLLLRGNEHRARDLCPDIVIVNSVGGDRLLSRLSGDLLACEQKVMIMRGSVGQFRNREYSEYDPEAIAHSMRTYTRIVFVSSITMKEWIDIGKLDSRKCHYIPNCINEAEVKTLKSDSKLEVRKLLGFPKDVFLVTCVANIQYMKGQDLIIHNLDKFVDECNCVKILLVGGMKDSWGRRLFGELSYLPDNDRVEYLGHRNDALKLVYASDLFLFPTRGEALPRSVLEAMILETPVLASSVDGIPELIDHEVDGYLFEKDNSEQMLEGFELLANDPELRAAFAESARDKYFNVFSKELQIQRYGELISGLIDQSL